MKRAVFLVLIVMVVGCISISNVFASSGLTFQEIIDMMSQPIEIVDGMYDDYTDSIYGMVYAHTPGEATITGVNKYNSSYVGRIPITVVGIGAQ